MYGMEKEDTNKVATFRKFPFSETAVLAVTPFFGYLFAYVYEVGYAGYFGVPVDLVSIDVPRIFVATGALLSVVLILFLLYGVLNPFLLELDKVPALVQERLVRLLFVLAFLVVFFYLYGFDWRHTWPMVFVLVLALFIEFIFPLFAQYRVRGYLGKLAAQDVIDAPDRSVLFPIIKMLGGSAFVLLFWLGIITYLTYHVGRAEAVRCQWFHCPSAISSVAVVRIYGNTIMGVRYDPLSHRLTGEILFGALGSEDWRELKWQKVGPLEPMPSNRGRHTD